MLEKKGLYGGLDSDTEDRLMKDGDYRPAYTLNLRNSIPDGATAGAIANVKGNTLIEFDMPGGTNTTIGTYDDSLNSRVIFFVHNENNAHKILLYSTTANTITQLVGNSLLNFSVSFPILHVDIIDDLLLWTDNNNEPSAILISTAQTGFYDSVTLRQYFDAICYAPNFCPQGVVYFSDSAYNQNNVRRKNFQFRYSYIDEMDRESAASPISKVSVPETEPIFFPASQYDTYQNNRIDFTINTGYDFVRKIRIFVREGNISDWYEAKTLDKDKLSIADNSTYTFNFYNDEAWIPVDQTYINRFFDFIPQKAQCQAQTSDKRITYSNIVEGYDNIEIDVIAEPQFHAIETIDTVLQGYINFNFGVINPVGGPGLSVTATVNGSFPQYTWPGIRINASNVQPEQIFTFSYNAIYGSQGAVIINAKETFSQSFPIGTPELTIANYFASQIQGNSTFNKIYTFGAAQIQFATTAYAQLVGGHYVVFADTAFTVLGGIPFLSPFVTKELQASVTSNALKKTLKKDSHYKAAMVYFDGPNRSGLCQVSDELDIQILPQSSNPGLIGHVSLRITINHTPPVWAKYYQILLTENNTKLNWLMFRCGTVTLAGDYYEILLDTLTGYNDFYIDATTLSYSFTAGDRMTVITDGSGSPAGTSGVYLSQYSDIEIFSEGTTGGGAQFIKIPNTIAVPPESGSLIELYSPKQTIAERLYYEIGEVHAITGGFHTGNIQNQTASQPAIIEFDCGDGYFRFRSGTFNSFVEDPAISDFYPSEVWDRGRTNVVDEEARQLRRPTTTYYSEPYVPETNINGLSTVFDDSFEAGDIKYGSIQKTYAEDDRIEFYYQLKTSFRLVKKSMLYDATGTTNVQISDNILSPESFYDGEYGIGNNPESFAVYGNARYHIDANRGLVMRLAGDGYTPISDYQMSTYFRSLLQTRLNFGAAFRAWGVYDVKHGEYVLCFEEVSKEVITDVQTDGDTVGVDPSVDLDGDTGEEIDGDTVDAEPDFDSGGDTEGTTEPTIRSAVRAVTVTSTAETVTLEPVTISFSEPKNRWVTPYAWRPECVGSANIGVVSYVDGKLYTHDTNELYNNFYGVQYTSKVQLISNLEPSVIKFYQNLFTESTHAWRVDATNPFGQATSLEYTDFEEREGVFYAQLLRDINTPVDLPILFGDVMRCHSMDIVLENNQTGETRLFAVNIRSERSMLTNM